MGEYTDTQRFYLADPEELVSVENDLNYNLRRADERVRNLVEYQYTDEQSITVSSLTKEQGFKWYKSYSNSVWFGRGTGTQIWQSVANPVDEWKVTGLSFESGYQSMDSDINRTAYCITGNWVRLRGRVIRTGQLEIPTESIINFLTLPDEAMPKRARYFTVWGGNATSDFQVFRVFIPAVTDGDKRMEMMKYGGNATSEAERYISLNDIFYPLDDNVPE